MRTEKPAAARSNVVSSALGDTQTVALKILGLPVSGLRKLAEQLTRLFASSPPGEMDWLDETRWPSERVRQEVLDAYWEEKLPNGVSRDGIKRP